MRVGELELLDRAGDLLDLVAEHRAGMVGDNRLRAHQQRAGRE